MFFSIALGQRRFPIFSASSLLYATIFFLVNQVVAATRAQLL
jgi:hypothetical protein